MGKPNKTLYLRSTFPVKCWSGIVFKVIVYNFWQTSLEQWSNGRNYYMYTEINLLKSYVLNYHTQMSSSQA